MKKRNLIYSIIIIAVGVFAFIYAGRYSNTSNLGSGNTGGDFFPRMMSVGLCLTGLTILFTNLFGKTTEEAKTIVWVDLLINIAMLVVYYLLLKPVGFIIDSALIIAFLMYRMGCRSAKQIIIFSLAVTLVIFCVFYYLMYVSLPLGVLAPIIPKY